MIITFNKRYVKGETKYYATFRNNYSITFTQPTGGVSLPIWMPVRVS